MTDTVPRFAPGRAKSTRWGGVFPAWLASALIMGLIGFGIFIRPRPYFITDIDSEQDYYYNARMIASGLPETVHHPGTPVHYLATGLLALSGDDLAETQGFFNLAYLSIGLLTVAGLMGFAALALRRESAPVAALALAGILAWPPFLTYLTILGADSFIVAVGLPAVALFWYVLGGERPKGWATLAACGASIGLCLAVKMSFVPVAIALLAGYLVWALRRPAPARSSRLAQLLVRARLMAPILLGATAGYLVAVAPVLSRVGVIWSRTANRPDVTPAPGGLLASLSTAAVDLVEHAPLWAALLAGACATAAVAARRGLRDRQAMPRFSASPAGPSFDLMAAGAFVGLMLLALLYTAAASTTISPGSAAGVRWRNMSPVALVVPMLILFAARARASRRRSGDSPHGARAPIAGVAVALVIAVSAMAAHLGERDRFITSHQRRVTATQDRLAELASGRGRVAFWTESSQDYLGAQSFHFWGNYRYANHAYDKQLAAWFPRYTFLRLRNFPGVSGADTAGDSTGTTRSRYGPLGEWYWNVRHTLLVDRPHYTSFQGVVAGKGVEGTVGLLALPAEELPELKGENDAARLATLTQRFATDSVWTEAIAGVPWILLARSGTGRRTALEGVPGRPR